MLKVNKEQIGLIITAVEARAIMWEQFAKDKKGSKYNQADDERLAMEYRMLAEEVRRQLNNQRG